MSPTKKYSWPTNFYGKKSHQLDWQRCILLGDLPFLLVPRFQGSITRALPQMGVVWISKVNESNKIYISLCLALSGFPLFSCYHVYEIYIYIYMYLISFNEIYLINIFYIVRTPTRQNPFTPLSSSSATWTRVWVLELNNYYTINLPIYLPFAARCSSVQWHGAETK